MYPLNCPSDNSVDSKTYPLDQNSEAADSANSFALVALSHTPVEHRLYCAMLSFPLDRATTFTARHLLSLSGLGSLSTVRRGIEGLLVKLSIERSNTESEGKRDQARVYRVYAPDEVIERRKKLGTPVTTFYANGNGLGAAHHSFGRAVRRVAENVMLTRREAQVALSCVEGLTNAEIGKRLHVSEQTVKFHLRHIFQKFGVKRRAELIARLLL